MLVFVFKGIVYVSTNIIHNCTVYPLKINYNILGRHILVLKK